MNNKEINEYLGFSPVFNECINITQAQYDNPHTVVDVYFTFLKKKKDSFLKFNYLFFNPELDKKLDVLWSEVKGDITIKDRLMFITPTCDVLPYYDCPRLSIFLCVLEPKEPK